MTDGFVRLAAATPTVRLADPQANARELVRIAREVPGHTALLVFPELCLTGYTCGDLFLQPTLLRAAERALESLLRDTTPLDTVLLVGLPVATGASVYNCAAVCQRGRLLGLVPKTHMPGYSQYYEVRQFAPAPDGLREIAFAGQTVRFGQGQLFRCAELPEFCLGVELCEDLWVCDPPSRKLAQAGATVIANLSASDESVGKADYRKDLVKIQSGRLSCAYVYASAGEGESSTDLVFSAHNLIAENGVVLAESERFQNGVIYTEADLQRLCADRRRLTPFTDTSPLPETAFSLPVTPLRLSRSFPKLPFVPAGERERGQRCEEILTMQSRGLSHRLSHTGSGAVLGLSGGLDSALALLVTARAYDRLGRDRADIHAVTMPCFGTTGRTLHNAEALAAAVGATLHHIEIANAVSGHLKDIAHDGAHDAAYENAQARERTQVLMDLANKLGGLVVGTGDLSELALGFATYNGDHMSMYGVNASVPKTLVRHLVRYEADRCGGELGRVLLDILDTPVSPELLPPQDGEIAQKTEELVGPYELHDFFLYYLLRFGYPPKKLYRLACDTFADDYPPAEIRRWLTLFLRRFFAQQFKRSCLPDGPRVGSVSLSPRGDWRMPSDAFPDAWLRDLDE